MKANIAAAGLLFVGLMQMAGDLLGIPALKGIGSATCASPVPKVFSAVRGLETYSTRFFIEWTGPAGDLRRLELTPEVNALLRGPYSRRNVFGAVLAYGPVLPDTLRDPVMRYGLCGRAPLLSELGIDPAQVRGAIRIRYEPVHGSTLAPSVPRILEVPCN